jgi:hypothetical protein
MISKENRRNRLTWHGCLDQPLDDVVVSAQRRRGPDEGPDRLALRLGQRLPLPTRDGLGIDEEKARGLRPAEAVTLHQHNDPETLLRRVVLALASRKALQASPLNLRNGADLLKLHLNQHTLGEAGLDRVVVSPPPRQGMCKTHRDMPRAGKKQPKSFRREAASASGNGVVRIRDSDGQERKQWLARRFFRHGAIVARSGRQPTTAKLQDCRLILRL